MAHSLSTVEKEYYVRNFEEGSAVGAKAIYEVFHCSPKRKSKKVWTLDEESALLNEFHENVTFETVRKSPIRLEATDKQVIINPLSLPITILYMDF